MKIWQQEKPIKTVFYYKSVICNINLGRRILGQGQISNFGSRSNSWPRCVFASGFARGLCWQRRWRL